MVYLRKTILFQGSGGGPTFPGGPIYFQGVQMLISIETYRTCDFPEGGGSPGSAHDYV